MSEKDQLATEIVKKYALYTAGVGLIPVPLVDLAGIAALEVKMLADLAKVYEVPFENDRVRPIVAGLIGGLTATNVGYGVGSSSMLKSVPVVGSLLGAFSVPTFAAATTYAIGKVFIQHFASGGTFLDFDPDKVREYFSGIKDGVVSTAKAAAGKPATA